jgi:hypothetical protein
MPDGQIRKRTPRTARSIRMIRGLRTAARIALVLVLAPAAALASPEAGGHATIRLNQGPLSATLLRPGSGYYNPSVSARVRALQTRLLAVGDSPGRIDGRYGRRTQLAVRRFQVAHGLHVDGIAGPRTLAALAAATPQRPPPLPPPREEPQAFVPRLAHSVSSPSANWLLLLVAPGLGLLLGVGWYTRRRLTDRSVVVGESPTKTHGPPMVEDAGIAFSLGVSLEHQSNLAAAEAAYRRADERGHAAAASNLGALLEERSDLAGAEAAYRRADERGDPNGAFNLGVLLERQSDPAGAEAAYRRADERGHAAAASNLGVLLEERMDVARAEAAYRRADERGDPNGAFNLGVLLEERMDPAGAEAAYQRADERGAAELARMARAALLDLRVGVSARAPLETTASISGGPLRACERLPDPPGM